MASFSLATSKKYRDANGEQKEDTQWHLVKVMGKSAETIERLHLAKGTEIMVEGEIAYRCWTDPQTGLNRTATEIVAFTFQLGAKPSSRQNAATASDHSQPTQQQPQGGWTPSGDDDLPF